MESLLITVAGYTVLFYFDIMPQIKKKSWKTLAISAPIMGLTFIVCIMVGFGFQFPFINKMIVEIVKGLGLK